jgi:glycosyltransferase involved in cell wall biosynthesis
MKIVIISPFQFRLRRGIERFTYSLANQLAKDYDLNVIIYSWKGENGTIYENWNRKIKIRKVPYFKYFQQFWARFFYYIWEKFDNPDKLVCNFLWHGETAIFNKRRDTIIFHNPVSQIPHRYNFSKKYIDHETSIIFDSNDSLKDFNNFFSAIHSGKVINTGVDIDYFKPSISKRNLKKLRIICISQFEERKGIQYLLKAIPTLLKECPLSIQIIGSGRYKIIYEKLIEELKIDEYVEIMQPVDDTRSYLLNSDIYFLLSHGEGFPLGLLEAMSCGIPVVTSNYPPFDEFGESIIHMVNRDEPADIAKAIIKLRNSEYYHNISKSSRDLIVNNFSWELIANKYNTHIFNNYK